MSKDTVDMGRVYDSGYDAVKSGLNPGETFFVKNPRVACGFETRKVVEEPGKHLSRGDFGSPVYASTAVFREEDGTLRPASFGEEISDWYVWDYDWGWLLARRMEKSDAASC